jgi:large subunit ribosomal protein L4
MTAVSVIGAEKKTVELPDEIFAAKVNVPLIHQVVVAQQAAARQGTHAYKTRGDVRGGGKKPYRQKGTGRARQGSIRAPQYAGGGVVHGPVPRSYVQRTPKKMKAAALRGALSDRLSHGRVQVVSGFVDGDVPRTKDAVAVLATAIGDLGRPVLVVAHRDDEITWKSLRNVPAAHVSPGPAQHLRRAGQRSRGVHRAGPDGLRFGVGFGGQQVNGTTTRDILLRPVVSEKSYGLLDEGSTPSSSPVTR